MPMEYIVLVGDLKKRTQSKHRKTNIFNTNNLKHFVIFGVYNAFNTNVLIAHNVLVSPSGAVVIRFSLQSLKKRFVFE